MSRIALFTQLQNTLGPEQAQAIAEYLEDSRQDSVANLVTKQELNDAVNRFELMLSDSIHESEMRIVAKIKQWSVIQLVTTIAAIIALSKFL